MNASPVKKRPLDRSLSADTDRVDIGARQRNPCKATGSIQQMRLGSSIAEENANPSSNSSDVGSSRVLRRRSTKFPKLEGSSHFHYSLVDTGKIQVHVFEESDFSEVRPHRSSQVQQDDTAADNSLFYLQIRSENNPSWIIQRTPESLCTLDRQLHRCVFDRKYSHLPRLSKDLFESVDSSTAFSDISPDMKNIVQSYFERFSSIADRNRISCATVLNWFEMDNRGHRMIASDSDAAINTPAVGAAHVIKSYAAQAVDELSLEIGDIVSIIDKPSLQECAWWRGKKQFEVGFFPAECVEEIRSGVPDCVARKVSPQAVKPVLRKRGKLIARLRAFFSSRPDRSRLKRSGIVQERVFGCDLSEHLLNSGHNVPLVLTFCADVIEKHGVTDGIYRLSGITSNIQRLRNEFDEDKVPSINEDVYVRDIHSISSLLKMYFRELPNPLLTYQLYDKFESAAKESEDCKLKKMLEVILQLPPPHYRTCAFLMKHLALIASHSERTNMTCRNLAIVWAPNLLRCKELEQMQCSVEALKNVGVQAVVTEFLISHADILFSDNCQVARDNSGNRPSRPKSLITPSTLLSLEEARQRTVSSDSSPPMQVYLDVGGGPSALPVYHTVLDLPTKGKRRDKPKKTSSSSRLKGSFHKGVLSDLSETNEDAADREPRSLPFYDGHLQMQDKGLQSRPWARSEQVLSGHNSGVELDDLNFNSCPVAAPPKPKRHVYKTGSVPFQTSPEFFRTANSSEYPAGDHGVSGTVFALTSYERAPRPITHRSYSVDSTDFDYCALPPKREIGLSISQAHGRKPKQFMPVPQVCSNESVCSDNVFPMNYACDSSLPAIGELCTRDKDDAAASGGTYVQLTSKPRDRATKATNVVTAKKKVRKCVNDADDVFQSNSDSDLEPLGGSREALSDPDHHISDLCLEDLDDECSEPVRRRFLSPVPFRTRCDFKISNCGERCGNFIPDTAATSDLSADADGDWHTGWPIETGSVSLLAEVTDYIMSSKSTHCGADSSFQDSSFNETSHSTVNESPLRAVPVSNDLCFQSPSQSPDVSHGLHPGNLWDSQNISTSMTQSLSPGIFMSVENSPTVGDSVDIGQLSEDNGFYGQINSNKRLIQTDPREAQDLNVNNQTETDAIHRSSGIGKISVNLLSNAVTENNTEIGVCGANKIAALPTVTSGKHFVGIDRTISNPEPQLNSDNLLTQDMLICSSSATLPLKEVTTGRYSSGYHRTVVSSGQHLVGAGSLPHREKSVKELKSKFEYTDEHQSPKFYSTGTMSLPLKTDNLNGTGNSSSSSCEFLQRSPQWVSGSASVSQKTVSFCADGELSSCNLRHESSVNTGSFGDPARQTAYRSQKSSSSPEANTSVVRRNIPPSINQRISCFEPIMSVGTSPTSLTENKRLRLSSCSSSQPDSSDKWKSNTVDSKSASDLKSGRGRGGWSPALGAEASDKQHSPFGSPDLSTLLNIPSSSAKNLPRVSERKRIFELDGTGPHADSQTDSTPSRPSSHVVAGNSPSAMCGQPHCGPMKVSVVDKENSFTGLYHSENSVGSCRKSLEKTFCCTDKMTGNEKADKFLPHERDCRSSDKSRFEEKLDDRYLPRRPVESASPVSSVHSSRMSYGGSRVF